jgi:hypothetical protein
MDHPKSDRRELQRTVDLKARWDPFLKSFVLFSRPCFLPGSVACTALVRRPLSLAEAVPFMEETMDDLCELENLPVLAFRDRPCALLPYGPEFGTEPRRPSAHLQVLRCCARPCRPSGHLAPRAGPGSLR